MEINYQDKPFALHHHSDENDEVATGLLLLWSGIYLFFIAYLKYSPINVYLISIFGFFLFIRWLSFRTRDIRITSNHYSESFLFFRKKQRITSYQIIQVKYDKDPNADSNQKQDEVNDECLLLQNEKYVAKFLKNEDPEFYDKLKDFVSKNLIENSTIKKSFLPFRITSSFVSPLFFYFVPIFLIISLGLYIENPKNTLRENFPEINGVLMDDSKTAKRPISNILPEKNTLNDTLAADITLKSGLSEIKLRIPKNEIRDLNNHFGKSFTGLKKGDSLTVFVDEKEYNIKVKRTERYPYFTSAHHEKRKDRLETISLIYQGVKFGDETDLLGTSRKEKSEYLYPLFFCFILLFAWIVSVFSTKIKY